MRVRGEPPARLQSDRLGACCGCGTSTEQLLPQTWSTQKKGGERSKGNGRRVWGAEFDQSLLASRFALVSLKELVEFILFFQNDLGKTASAARN